MKLDPDKIKQQFNLFKAYPDMVYLDNAATTQKPNSVIEGASRYLTLDNGSPNRGAHQLSVRSTNLYETAREKVRAMLNARDGEEIIFTRNATESLNLIGYSYGLPFIEAGRKILVAITSHHSNILPWQMVAKAKGARLEYLYTDEYGHFLPGELEKIDGETALVTFPLVSNGLGVIHDPKPIIAQARRHGAVVVVDGAQAVGHMQIDLQEMDVDFFVFSGHKVFGPQGIGVLYGKKNLLDKMPPFLRGGDMIEYVTEQETTFAELPKKFEAGTQNVSGAYGLGLAIDFINEVGVDEIQKHEKELTGLCYGKLKALPYVTIYGPSDVDERGALITFSIEGVHPHDVASIMDAQGIAIRAGHHCCQPLMARLGLHATCRVSFSIYNTLGDIDRFIEGIKKVREVFGYVD